MPLVVITSGRLYHDFIRLLFFQVHRETSVLDGHGNHHIIQNSTEEYKTLLKSHKDVQNKSSKPTKFFFCCS
jgi:hypothetical protein